MPPERAPKPASLVAGLSPLFLAAQGGAATDEVWFVGIFAIGAVVGLLVLAFQFVGRQRQPGVSNRSAATAHPGGRGRYCTRCGEPLDGGAHACMPPGQTRQPDRHPGNAR